MGLTVVALRRSDTNGTELAPHLVWLLPTHIYPLCEAKISLRLRDRLLITNSNSVPKPETVQNRNTDDERRCTCPSMCTGKHLLTCCLLSLIYRPGACASLNMTIITTAGYRSRIAQYGWIRQACATLGFSLRRR